MVETRIKTVFMLLGEALVIWYGMGTPIPTNAEEGIKLIVALLAIVYTGWKNHDFTIEGVTGTAIAREMKALRDLETAKEEEPDDSFIIEDEDGGEADGEE